MVSLGQYVINCWSNYFVSKCVAINKSLKTSFHTEKTKGTFVHCIYENTYIIIGHNSPIINELISNGGGYWFYSA